MQIQLTPTKKQHEAYRVLFNKETKELLFGGAAGGAKSWLLAEYLTTQALRYPGTRWLMGRKELKQLKATTLNTFFKVCKHHNISQDLYSYNSQSGVIKFANESEIVLSELKRNPSDPEFQDLGSLELTGAAIDEAGEIEKMAFEVLKTRVGRQMNKEYKILPKVLMTANPIKNWLYKDFYKPWRDGTLPPHKAFIQALPTDNPYLDENYLEQLRNIEDQATRERLLHGNWDYDDDPDALMSWQAITDLFTNTIVNQPGVFISADIARFGSDKTVLMAWRGLEVVDIQQYNQVSVTQSAQLVRDMAHKHKVPYSNIIVDEDGIGGGVVDLLGGVKGFIANSTPFAVVQRVNQRPENFQNLKAQCSYKLASYVNQHKIKITTESSDIMELITEELAQVRSKDRDKDGKLKIVSKDEVKLRIGRSPDFADALMMRMYFEYDQTFVRKEAIIQHHANKRKIQQAYKTQHGL